MEKKKAKNQALENDKTWGDLLDIVENANKSGTSTLNPSMKKSVVVEILKASICERDLSEVPQGKIYDIYNEKMIMSRDGKIISNILIEFG